MHCNDHQGFSFPFATIIEKTTQAGNLFLFDYVFLGQCDDAKGLRSRVQYKQFLPIG